MRVYLPATTATLRELVDTSQIQADPLVGFAVTPALREWYDSDEDEELVYAALSDAARASLRLLDADPAADRRRVVVAADVDEAGVSVRDDLERGVVHLSAPVPMAAIASVHVDDTEAEPVVARAAAHMIEADLGDPEAQDAVDDAEGFELSWYASQEVALLLELG